MGLLLFILFLVLGIVVSHWWFIGCGALLLLWAWPESGARRGTTYYGARRRRRGGR